MERDRERERERKERTKLSDWPCTIVPTSKLSGWPRARNLAGYNPRSAFSLFEPVNLPMLQDVILDPVRFPWGARNPLVLQDMVPDLYCFCWGARNLAAATGYKPGSFLLPLRSPKPCCWMKSRIFCFHSRPETLLLLLDIIPDFFIPLWARNYAAASAGYNPGSFTSILVPKLCCDWIQSRMLCLHSGPLDIISADGYDPGFLTGPKSCWFCWISSRSFAPTEPKIMQELSWIICFLSPNGNDPGCLWARNWGI